MNICIYIYVCNENLINFTLEQTLSTPEYFQENRELPTM